MNKIANWYFHKNVYLKFLPFLFFYILICLVFSGKDFYGDEPRYVAFANNLLHGFYSPSYPNINLWNGPGYPIILMPFVFFKLPYLLFRLLNAFFLYFSLIITYNTICNFSTKKAAIFFTIVLGFYYPVYYETIYIVTEPFTWLLISLLCFLFIKCFQQKEISWKILILTAFTIAYLAMTKVVFGYVIFIMICISLMMFFVKAYRDWAKKATLLFLIAFIFCLPWLFYTYSLTHKAFFWADSGSLSLYTMSSPYENELGDWDIVGDGIPNPKRAVFMDSVSRLQPMQREAAYQDAAIQNIKAHPKKYASNWLANIGRLFFSLPFSNKVQSLTTYFTLIPNMFIVVIMVFVLGVSTVHYKKFPFAFVLLFLFLAIYLFGSSLVSAYRRMFHITMPYWIILIAYFFSNVVEVRFRGDKKKGEGFL